MPHGPHPAARRGGTPLGQEGTQGWTRAARRRTQRRRARAGASPSPQRQALGPRRASRHPRARRRAPRALSRRVLAHARLQGPLRRRRLPQLLGASAGVRELDPAAVRGRPAHPRDPLLPPAGLRVFPGGRLQADGPRLLRPARRPDGARPPERVPRVPPRPPLLRQHGGSRPCGSHGHVLAVHLHGDRLRGARRLDLHPARARARAHAMGRARSPHLDGVRGRRARGARRAHAPERAASRAAGRRGGRGGSTGGAAIGDVS